MDVSRFVLHSGLNGGGGILLNNPSSLEGAADGVKTHKF